MKTKMDLCVGVCAVVGAIAAGQASASEFYGLTTTGALTRFDMTAHTVTTVSNLHAGATALNVGFSEMESDGAGNLYALRSYSGSGFPPPSFNEIIRITNPTTGNALLSASIGGTLANVHSSLAFRPSNGLFYTVRNQNGFLGTLDLTTAVHTPVSGVAHGSPFSTQSLAVNPVTGLAYALVDRGIAPLGTVDFTLLSMNLDTGLSTTIGSLGLGTTFAARITGGLRFDDAAICYTVNPQDGNVYTVDVTTGAASFLFAGGTNAMGTAGIAFIPVPAPATLSFTAISLIAVSRRRRRS